jgi:asparagine synthase (glutamine-hydrolysing)
MCGLSAIFSQTGLAGCEIKNLNDAIKHRGPDDEGFFCSSTEASVYAFGEVTPMGAITAHKLSDINTLQDAAFNVMLGHRRLSIVDTSWRGHQPMKSECGGYSMIYNGEVYNSDELAAELRALGHKFDSCSDTEVVLAAFIQWGSNCLEKFNGMFSFVIFNHETKSVLIARDRYGIKPLYYYYPDDGSVAFASEIKQFTKLDGWSAVLNRSRAVDYLNWGQTDHTNETLFTGVFQVPAGHFCEFNISSVPEVLDFTRWYSLEPKIGTLDYEHALTAFRNTFRQSVRYRLKADVPVGTCLSGGLDSSAIACTINDIIEAGQEQITFSSCSSDKEYDESEYVEAVLDQCKNIQPHRIEVDHQGFWAELNTLIYHHDEPFLSPSVYAEWCIFREVSKTKVKVTLDGHGADEILYGYDTFFGPYLSGLLRQFKFLEYAKSLVQIRRMHGWGLPRLLAMSARSFLPDAIKDHALRVLNRPTRHTSWINKEALGDTAVLDIGMTDKNAEDVSLDQLLRFSVPKQLKWCDRDSMAHSIESRVPFLDYKLVELLYSLPTDFKLKRGLTKRVLRDGLSGDIPKVIEQRISKMGFVTPGERWVVDNPDEYKKKLQEAIDHSGVMLNKSECLSRFTKMIDGKIPFDNSFWRVVFFGEWIKCYGVKV